MRILYGAVCWCAAFILLLAFYVGNLRGRVAKLEGQQSVSVGADSIPRNDVIFRGDSYPYEEKGLYCLRPLPERNTGYAIHHYQYVVCEY
jgi:hypothetical protein